jgi:hypothetical protein
LVNSCHRVNCCETRYIDYDRVALTPLQHLSKLSTHKQSCTDATYPEDLCQKVVQAVERGMPTSGVAHLFGVSPSPVKCYARTARWGESLAPRMEVDGRRRWVRALRRSSKKVWSTADRHRCRKTTLTGAPHGNPTQRGCGHQHEHDEPPGSSLQVTS